MWEGKDRYIFIEENPDPDKSPEIVVVLKLFYGWYYDRAAEPKEISDAYAKARNDGTGKEAQHITMEINNINTYSVSFLVFSHNSYFSFFYSIC